MPPTLHGGADALVRSRVQHPTFNHIWDGTVTGTGISIKGQKRAAARAVMPTTRFFFFLSLLIGAALYDERGTSIQVQYQ